VARIERSLSKGRISLEELLSREVMFIALLLRSNVGYADVEPDTDSLMRAEEIASVEIPMTYP